MNRKTQFNSFRAITLDLPISLITACGGGGSGSSDEVQTGRFIDSPVPGLTFTTASQSGITPVNWTTVINSTLIN